MAGQARANLEVAVSEFIAEESLPFRECLEVLGVDDAAPEKVEAAFADLEKAFGRSLR